MRVLMYSHDSFGLGHLRRCQTIAHALINAFDDVSVLILSGSPIISSFDFQPRVDFVRIPGIIKLKNGEYTSLQLHTLKTEETLALRASIIENTANIFDPNLFIVDKEPWGLRGEVMETLKILRKRGTACVLGLRDVLDDKEALQEEWKRKKALDALPYYDAIWIYGLAEIYQPLQGLDIPGSIQEKIAYTGYLRRTVDKESSSTPANPFGRPYILVTAGGGGDGENMVEWVLRAYEHDPSIPHPALVVCGPFMQAERYQDFMQRSEKLSKLMILRFENHFETLFTQASAVVAMGGYNTFCEILSFDKPALLIPRTVPRKEQLIRAQEAQKLGLLKMLSFEDSGLDAQMMADALRQLPSQPAPSQVALPGLLDGLPRICSLAEQWLYDKAVTKNSKISA